MTQLFVTVGIMFSFLIGLVVPGSGIEGKETITESEYQNFLEW